MQIIAHPPRPSSNPPSPTHPPINTCVALVDAWTADENGEIWNIQSPTGQRGLQSLKFKPLQTMRHFNETLSIHQLFFYLFEVAFPDCHQILHNHTLYQTLVLFLVAKTSADNLSQGFRTELPLTYRLLPTTTSAPHFFSLLTTSLLFFSRPPPCSCLLIHRAAARRRFLFKSCSFVSGWR